MYQHRPIYRSQQHRLHLRTSFSILYIQLLLGTLLLPVFPLLESHCSGMHRNLCIHNKFCYPYPSLLLPTGKTTAKNMHKFFGPKWLRNHRKTRTKTSCARLGIRARWGRAGSGQAYPTSWPKPETTMDRWGGVPHGWSNDVECTGEDGVSRRGGVGASGVLGNKVHHSLHKRGYVAEWACH